MVGQQQSIPSKREAIEYHPGSRLNIFQLAKDSSKKQNPLGFLAVIECNAVQRCLPDDCGAIADRVAPSRAYPFALLFKFWPLLPGGRGPMRVRSRTAVAKRQRGELLTYQMDLVQRQFSGSQLSSESRATRPYSPLAPVYRYSGHLPARWL
jgi:hypothetical protein